MKQWWDPRKYQLHGVELMISNPAYGLLWDPGLGKTATVLAAFQILKEQGIMDSMLVVAPRRVIHSTWPDEINHWFDFKDLTYAVLHGNRKEQALGERADVYLINPEGLEWLCRSKWAHWPRMLVLDESTKFKHTNTQRFKLMRKTVLPKFDRRYILTGTPVPNGLHDIFGQVFCLDMGKALGTYVSHFRRQWFHRAGYGGYSWNLNPDAEEDIYERIAPITQRLENKDYLELPPKIEVEVKVDLPDKAIKIYDGLRKDFLAELEEGEVTAFNAGVLTSKLRQIANGAVYLDAEPGRKRQWKEIHNAKVEALREIVDELNGAPVVVLFEFHHDRDRLHKAFKAAPVIDGTTTDAEGAKILRAWNAGEVPVLLAHPQSIAHGLNIQKGGCHMVWFGLTYNLEHDTQAVARLYRSGQKKRVIVHRLVARNTVDEFVVKALRKKDQSQKALFRYLKQWAKENA